MKWRLGKLRKEYACDIHLNLTFLILHSSAFFYPSLEYRKRSSLRLKKKSRMADFDHIFFLFFRFLKMDLQRNFERARTEREPKTGLAHLNLDYHNYVRSGFCSREPIFGGPAVSVIISFLSIQRKKKESVGTFFVLI